MGFIDNCFEIRGDFQIFTLVIKWSKQLHTIPMKILYVIGWPIHINEYKQMLKILTFVSQFEVVVNPPHVGKDTHFFFWTLIIYIHNFQWNITLSHIFCKLPKTFLAHLGKITNDHTFMSKNCELLPTLA
jgi:hypothetical protein